MPKVWFDNYPHISMDFDLPKVNQKKYQVEKIEMKTPLNKGFDGEENNNYNGLLLGKEYTLKVEKFKDDLIPENEEIIKWSYSYTSNKGESVIGAFKSKGSEVTFNTNDIEACGCEITFYCYITEQKEEAELSVFQHNLFRGTFLWTETKGTGHTFLSVHKNNEITLFTYGRYDDADWIPISGEGVLIKFTNDLALEYMQKELFRLNANVFKVNDVHESIVFNIYDKIWKSSNELPDSGKIKTDTYGKVIDKYDLTGNNCTTESIEILEKAGTELFKKFLFKYKGKKIGQYDEDFVIPSSLENYLNDNQGKIILKDTKRFKEVFNVTTFNELNKAGSSSESSGSSGDSSGSSANSSSTEDTSSGSSPASSGGLIGSSSND